MVEAKRAWQGFWRWWTGELVALLPAGLRGWLGLGHQGGWLLRRDGAWRLFREPAVESVALGALDPTHADGERDALRAARNGVYVGLERDMLLERDIELPLAAQENLREVLGYEMDRHTPFRSDQAWFDYRVLERDSLAGRLKLRLYLAPTHLLEELMQGLRNLRIPVRGVAPLQAVRDGMTELNLLPAELRDRPSRLPHLINLLLALSLLTLLGLAAALPLQRQQAELVRLQPLLNAARAEAEETRRLREQLEQAGAAARFMPQRLQNRMDLLVVLEEVTRLLPDETWLRQFELEGREVRLFGESAAAAALVPLLESSPLFAEVGFRSPVTQDPRSGSERFQLGMRLVAPEVSQ